MLSGPKISRGTPAVVLAPMEGVTDAPMRALMAERGGIDFTVSEFLRVSQDVPPARTFREHVPEALNDWKTGSGVPVQVQLLGGDAEKLANAALVAVSVGARAVDLNFGCPAPTVNRHDGGATLLKYPHRIREIVSAVRNRLPAEIPVSAKLRLGFDSMDSIFETASAAQEGGAAWITIHGRTKVQGYKPPAYWFPIGKVREMLQIPVVANGDIWTLEDFRRCREETGCEHYMLGRGALADPALPLLISRELGIGTGVVPENFGKRPSEWVPILRRFAELSKLEVVAGTKTNYIACRIKQWTKIIHLNRKLEWFDFIKTTQSLDELFAVLESHG